MTKSLLGGGAALALLSASFMFYANPTVAEPLALTQEPRIQQTSELSGTTVSTDATDVPARPFTATAYSLRGRTASGKTVARGLIAADRRVLPLGTRVRLDAGRYSGEYTVADTGGAVRGRKIDIWMPNTSEAMRFGRQTVKLTVLTKSRKPVAPATTTTRAKKRV
jgi:3D (Asp-Asp-Asp) domain-containing protein